MRRSHAERTHSFEQHKTKLSKEFAERLADQKRINEIESSLYNDFNGLLPNQWMPGQKIRNLDLFCELTYIYGVHFMTQNINKKYRRVLRKALPDQCWVYDNLLTKLFAYYLDGFQDIHNTIWDHLRSKGNRPPSLYQPDQDFLARLVWQSRPLLMRFIEIPSKLPFLIKSIDSTAIKATTFEDLFAQFPDLIRQQLQIAGLEMRNATHKKRQQMPNAIHKKRKQMPNATHKKRKQRVTPPPIESVNYLYRFEQNFSANINNDQSDNNHQYEDKQSFELQLQQQKVKTTNQDEQSWYHLRCENSYGNAGILNNSTKTLRLRSIFRNKPVNSLLIK